MVMMMSLVALAAIDILVLIRFSLSFLGLIAATKVGPAREKLLLTIHPVLKATQVKR